MRLRNTLIMAIVAALLGAAVYFFEIRGAEEREAAEAVAERLVHFETDDVTGLTIDGSEGTISLVKSDDSWRITAPHDLAADQSAVSSIVSRLQGADHERVVEEAPEDLSRFGLDVPEVTVTLDLADGSEHRLLFGAGTPVGFNVFVKTGDADTVYTAAAGIKDAVDKKLFDLRDRKVLSFADADIQRIEIDAPTGDVTVARQPDMGDGIQRWQITAPLTARADTDEVTGLMQRLRSANAVAFASDEPNDEQIAEYGLDTPAVTLRLWTGQDAAQTLLVGGSSEQPAGRYARREGSEAVMIVPNNMINELPASAAALRNRTVVEFARDRVDTITVQHGDDSVRAEKDGVDWNITVPRPLAADTGAISSLLSAALNLRAREFPEGGPEAARFGFADPHERVTFELEALPGDDTGAGQPAEQVTLLLGNSTEVEPEDAPEGEDAAPVAARYAMVEGGSDVFVVEESALADLDVDLLALRSKTLVSFAQSDLTGIELITPDGTVTLTKDADGAWTRDGEALSEDAGGAVDDLLWRLNYLDMQSIVSEEEGVDPTPYGLTVPRLRVRALIDETVVGDVAIGDDVPESELQELPPFAPQQQVYAAVAGHAGVFRIGTNLRDAAQALLAALS
jgi:hypothetical protein